MSATQLRRLHFWLTILWAVAIPVSIVTGWIGSIVFLGAISIYANLAGHFAAWQGSRAEQAANGD